MASERPAESAGLRVVTMAVRLALAGDTMLGRGVADALASRPPESLVASEVAEVCRDADLFLLNLECCISERGSPRLAPGKPFHFRAPPEAVETLLHLGVSCVTLANNHAVDYGEEALLDTLELLDSAGVRWVGAGPDVEAARRPAVLEASGLRLAVIGVTDHPPDTAAGPGRPGTAYADLGGGVPGWLTETVRVARGETDVVLATAHWGPNMVSEPVPHVRRTAGALVEAGASLVAGHSAHVFHGVRGRVLYDLGDFLDDYRVDPVLRNDLGLLWLVTLERSGPARLEALPLRLEHCFTRFADGEDAAWVWDRFLEACAALGTPARREGRGLVVDLGGTGPRESKGADGPMG